MKKYIDKQWQLAMQDFSKNITSIGMDLWINPLEPINIDDDKLVLVTPTAMARDTILRSYASKILPIIKQYFNVSDIHLVLLEDRESYIKEYQLSHPDTAENLEGVTVTPPTMQNPFNPRYTFENFVVGTTNQVIYAAARTVAEQPGKKFNPLFIYGGTGLGKTHLLHAIGNYIWEHKTGNINIMYTTCEDFCNDFIESLRKRKEKGMIDFRTKYREADVLLIDDIQFIGNKEGVQEEFFNTFNALYQGNKQIIITSDRLPKDIPTLTDRLISRFGSGFMQDIQRPDFETRLLIIQKKIELEGYNFLPGIDFSLAERLNDYNIREIEGILAKLYFYATMHGQSAVSKEVMEEVMISLGKEEQRKNNTLAPERIIDAVCEYYTISKQDLVGRKRNKEIVEPRQVCIYLMWSMLTIPLSTIGEVFSRDHTTIIHARDKILDQVKNHPPTKKVVTEITQRIRENVGKI